ncbi:MAG: hypothetical protein V4510_02250 [bacterium]
MQTDMAVRYVAVVQVPDGSRLFCSDQYRDEWTSRLGYAETFRALYDALAVAQRHGGQVLLWREAHELSQA